MRGYGAGRAWEVERLSRRREKKLMDRDNSVVEGNRGGSREINGDGPRLELEWGTHNTMYR